MNKIYEKGVTRNQQASSHTLAILMSMLRVCLEYGWSMARVWLKYAWSMPGVCLEYAWSMPTTRFLRPFSSKRAELERRLVGHEITAHSRRDYGSLITSLRLVVSMLLMLTLGTGSVWGQTLPFEVTTDPASPNYYLLQNVGTTSFYAMPYDNTEEGKVSTTNVPNEDMRFYFLNAGEDNGIQYYYIVHSSGRYLYAKGNKNDNDGARLKTPTTTSPDDNRYKFYVTTCDDSKVGTGYYIINKELGDTAPLCKRSGNSSIENGTFLKLNTYTPRDAYFLWNFIPKSNTTTLTWIVPFTLSTNVEKHYYKINNSVNTSFYISRNISTDKVNTSSTASEDMYWYFEEVPAGATGSDDYITYYYIIHALTGKYMCFDGDASKYTQNQDNAVSIQTKTNDNEEKCQFIVTRSSQRAATTLYNIIPKTLKSYIWKNQSIGQKNTTNGTNVWTATDRNGNTNSARWEFFEVQQVAKPVIQYDATQNAIIITSDTEGATIYYTTAADEASLVDPTPSTGTACNSGELLQNGVSNKYIKAIAVKEDCVTSEVSDLFSPVMLKCSKPTLIKNNVGTYTFSCAFPASGVTIYYTTDGSTPTTGSSSCSSGYTTSFADGTTIKFMAVATDYSNSEVVSKTIVSEFPPGAGDGTAANPYEISTSDLFDLFVDNVNNDGQNGVYYKVTEDIDVSSCAEITTAFQGNLDGDFHKLSGLSHPLFNTLNGGTVKNVTLKNVAISSSEDYVGAIAGIAQGYSRIYNCGILPNDATFPEGFHPTVNGGTYAGGIVGKLDGDSRVINCYSYADVSASTTVAGIVGYNNFASTAKVTDGKYTELKTAVVNCMFYGDIIGGSSRYPVYGGEKIVNNTETGINNYDFYRAEASVGTLTDYNCSWPAKEEYLTRYEFYRNLLNSNRELCGWWVGAPSAPSEMSTEDVQKVAKDASLMAKWVLDTEAAPYPILKKFGKYSSPVNIDADASWRTTANEWEGKKLGTLKVTIDPGTYAAGGASTKSGVDFVITDMDTLRNDYCYRKIQLPYYNTVFGNPNDGTWASKYGGNYGDNVVIGWKVSTSEGTEGELSENWETGYNFADRNCTAKDANRVFAQGGYYYVPNGVENITITAQWASAIYLDNTGNYYDRVSVSAYSTTDKGISVGSSTLHPFAPAGTRPTKLGNGKTVQNGTISSKIPASGSVYGNAIVLVGNNQSFTGGANIGNSGKGGTIMSADFDFDDEPDYCLIWQLGTQTNRFSICPIRFDFLSVAELGLAMKEDGSTQYYSLGCYRPLGHFEVTETSLIHFGQFEYGNVDRTINAPLILNGGIFDQYTKGTRSKTTANDLIDYIIIGGNVRIPSFTPGAHVSSSAKYPTRHCAVNVIGGNIDYLYLTGNFNEEIAPNQDSPHCYVDGGRFKQVAAAGKEGIYGDVTFKINHSKIWEFYGGSTMDQATGNYYKIVKGNINVTIDNSIVDKYCGGPKFGDMIYDENNFANSKTITTNATNTIFGVYYGGGNGGTSYVQYDKTDGEQPISDNFNWNGTGKLSSYNPGSYRSGKANYMADYDMEIVNTSAGTNQDNAIYRSYFYAAQFSATNTGSVTNNLTDCKVLTNFYGGGNLGGVIGDVTSKLDNCTVTGSVFGAGYSASAGTVTISNKDKTPPVVNKYTGIIKPQSGGTSTTYYWTHDAGTTASPITTVGGKKYFYTELPLDNLGSVSGKVTLNIEGTTTVGESVYGGGEESGVGGNTEVNVTGGTIGTTNKGGATWGNVYGGGKGKEKNVTAGLVKGNTTINISQAENQTTTIIHNVYGGGAYGSVGDFTYDGTTGMPTALATANTGACTINITGGTLGSDGKENGMVFGSSRGDVATPEGEPAVDPNDRMAWVYSTHVTIGDANVATSPTIKGSIYGSGENGHTFQNTIVDINKGIIGITSGSTIVDDNGTPDDTSDDKSYSGAAYPYRGNVYGGGCGTDKYDSNSDGIKDKYNPLAGIVQGTATVNITGGHVVHNVYGAGAMGSVGGGAEANSGKTTINVTGGRIGYDGDGNGYLFGAARGEFGVSTAASGLAHVRETEVNINYTTTPTADNEGKTEQLIAGTVFGGGEAGTVKESVIVNMTGGLILKDIYGGGALADTQTSNWNATANSGAGDWADADKKSALNTTTVRLTGGRVGEEVFGGGLGEAGKPAYVWGDVLVDLNGTTTSGTTGTPIANNAKGCVVGQIFGCNNVNGTPKGDVMVHVYATQNAAATQIANAGEVTNAKVKGRYDVTAVYGGGNQAVYNPVTPYDGTSGSKTKVIIEGCDLTSIETVYGGGNAAAVPETNVTIYSAYEIGYLFGGGNGKDDIAPGVPNPGADVGTPDHGTSNYGTGNANTLMEGGLIHEAYGGSNTKGIIKGSINQITDPKDPSVDPGCCELVVEKIVGAGKYADVDGDVNMTLSCQPERKVNLLFAGADEANVNGNITLNITNGHFGKVFGGNNLGGAIKGKITVNVEETGCQPIKIDDLYLGGNEAAYSVFGYYESEEIHKVTGKNILKPRTSATDPNLPVKLDGTSYTSIDQFTNYAQPELNIISCTYIGNVFGGGFGEGAVMYANPTVNVNMEAGLYADTAIPDMMTELGLDVTKTAPNPDKLGIIRNVFGGGDAANIAGDTHVNIATEEGKSAYIIGSVFGGGNEADVLGNTNVTMSDGYVFNGIFGGGYAGSVGTFTRSTAAADVNIYGHTAHTGCIGKPVSCATGTGKCTVVVNGGQIGPISVATEGMNRSKADGGPVPEGWVWGAGQGLIQDPAEYPDTHFTSYVGETDVTIGGTAFVLESIIGGGEFGRVLGDTKVTIQDHCQIGVGAGKVDTNNKPIRYTDGYDYGAGATTNQFIDPTTTAVTESNALAECSHFPYGEDTNKDGIKDKFLPYDPYYDKYLAKNSSLATSDLGPASTASPSDGKTWIGCVFAGGSGYMPYEKEDGSGYDWCSSAGLVEGNTNLTISGGHILTNVYGGNEVTDVKGKSIVKMTGGTIGVPRTLEQIAAHPVTCYLFGAGKGDDRSHFYNYTNTGSVEVEVSGGIIYGSVFGGSEDGHVIGDIKVDIKPGAIIGTWGTSYVDGNVFGAGRGFSGNTLTAGNVGGNVTLNISGGDILGSVYGGGRLASVGTYQVPSNDANYGKLMPDNGNDKHGHITVNISGGTIGNSKEYIYNPTDDQKAAIPNTTFDYLNHLQYTKGGNVFTAGMGRLYALDNTTVLTSWQKLGQCKSTTLNMTDGTVKSSVYGGGEIGIVAQNATLNIDGGTVGTKLVDSEDATKYYYFGSVFGGGKGSKESIEGISAAGTTQGDVEVHLNKTPSTKGAIVNQVFGCNDMNGSPKGDVTVHVYATQNADKDDISTKYAKDTEKFDVEAVYGGGNLAAYEPEGGKNTTKSTKVIIDGCGLTSIKQVYGGGNAASTPATNVVINGTYEILELFGGGNGFDNLPDGKPNPGANVGYKNYTIYEKVGDDWVAKDDPAYDTKEERTASTSDITYGTGQASINVFGGTIHRVFGGSNTKGNVRQTAVTLLDENSGCEFCVDEAYGGGKSAPMDAEAKLLMACIPGLQAAYGGAEAAAIKGNVTLNITNGTFDRVFGGNNLSGTIEGSITVNIEEVGCRPIKIGELYGGGNQAGYSVYGYNDDGTPKETGTKLYEDPQVNVMSFTSIGKVFGGGYGDGATMVGNPTVSVNEVYGKYYNDDSSVVNENAETPNHYPIPSHAKGKMGAIHTVFGGGNAAKVMGNTTVNIATAAEVYIVKEVTAGEALPEGCYTRSGAGTTDDPFVYTSATGTASTDVTYYEKKDVLGVDIRDNIYGGGNNAQVTGNAVVNVGKKVEE